MDEDQNNGREHPLGRVEWKMVPFDYTPSGKTRVVHFEPYTGPKKIICAPTPCKDGWHYCPDWFGITEHG